MIVVVRTIGLFIAAAVCEISGAYFVWQWRHNDKPLWFVLAGMIALLLYAFIQTAQSLSFGRAFAAYGGVFIATAALWGWWIDGRALNRSDWLGVAIALVGAAIIVWGPRD